MAIVKFSSQELLDLGLPDFLPEDRGKIVENVPISNSRWSSVYRLIFELDGSTYETTYSEGATEMQDEQPWEYEPMVSCTEVKPIEVTKTAWVPVDDESTENKATSGTRSA